MTTSTASRSIADDLTDVSWLTGAERDQMIAYYLARHGQYWDGRQHVAIQTPSQPGHVPLLSRLSRYGEVAEQ